MVIEINTETIDTQKIRRADQKDIEQLIALRLALFRDMGYTNESDLRILEKASRNYFRQALDREEYIAWVSESGEKITSTVGLVIHMLPPTVANPHGKTAYIMSVYTEPEWRKKGLARLLMNELLKYIRQEGIRLATLRTTESGRSLYESLGFVSCEQMRLSLNRESDINPEIWDDQLI